MVIKRWVEREIPIATLRMQQPEDRLRINKKCSLRISAKEQWLEGEMGLLAQFQVWYTDGYKMA